MKRIIRDRRLTSEEAVNYQAIREQVKTDLPALNRGQQANERLPADSGGDSENSPSAAPGRVALK